MLLVKEAKSVMPEQDDTLSKNKEELLLEIESLRKQIRRLKLEKDVLEGTVEIIKKEPGADPENMTKREKAILADALRKEHPLRDLLDLVRIRRSSFYYQQQIALAGDKYETLKCKIIELFEANGGRYGYRRIHALLVREGNTDLWVVRRSMTECALTVFGRKRRKYSSYQDENAPAAENIIERDFHASAPNTKWLRT